MITDLGPNVTIDLTGLSGINDITDLTLTQDGNNTVIELPDGGTMTVLNRSIAEVVAQLEVRCLLRGTMVLTPGGEVPVESLPIGDKVLSVDGSLAALIRRYGGAAAAPDPRLHKWPVPLIR